MRRLSPSQELLTYLDYELEGKVPPIVRTSRPARRVPRRAALVVAALAIVLTGIGVATLAFAQDAGARGRHTERAHRPAAEPVAQGSMAEPRAERETGRRWRREAVATPPLREPAGEDLGEASPPLEVLPPGERSVEQEAASVVSREPEEMPSHREDEVQAYSCCARPYGDPPGVPPLEPPAPRSGSAASSQLLALVGVLLLVLAIALVFVPGFVRRSRARRRGAVRAAAMAVESRRGGRRSNEDRSAAFSVEDCDVLIVADGMGGHIGGARAASIAVETASDYLVRRLPLARDTELVEDLVRSAFIRAAEALAAEDAEIGLGGRGVDALRTTLIVAVATPDDYVVGAQGDGGAWAQRASGITVTLMKPAKGDASNIVTASLGPAPEGQVEITTKRRMKGDLLVVCSDGVADRVGPEFDEALRAYADDATDANEIVRPILDSFEERPVVFDDNITLGILFTP